MTQSLALHARNGHVSWLERQDRPYSCIWPTSTLIPKSAILQIPPFLLTEVLVPYFSLKECCALRQTCQTIHQIFNDDCLLKLLKAHFPHVKVTNEDKDPLSTYVNAYQVDANIRAQFYSSTMWKCDDFNFHNLPLRLRYPIREVVNAKEEGVQFIDKVTNTMTECIPYQSALIYSHCVTENYIVFFSKFDQLYVWDRNKKELVRLPKRQVAHATHFCFYGKTLFSKHYFYEICIWDLTTFCFVGRLHLQERQPNPDFYFKDNELVLENKGLLVQRFNFKPSVKNVLQEIAKLIHKNSDYEQARFDRLPSEITSVIEGSLNPDEENYPEDLANAILTYLEK